MTIEDIVTRDFQPEEQHAVLARIDEMARRRWGVGTEQLTRSVLMIAQGSLRKFDSIFPIADPRDVLMEANSLRDVDRRQYFPPKPKST